MLALLPLFAQLHNAADWSIGGIVIACIIIGGIIGVALVVLKVAEIKVPWWVVQICIIVAVCFAGVVAVKLLLSMW